MPPKTLLIALVALAVLVVAQPASAAQPHRYTLHGKHKHCRKGYRRVKRTHKTFCIKRAKKRGAALAEKVKLHAHLDPTYTRNPLDPFEVTYAYSASATQEPAAGLATVSAEEPAPLPKGVLSFYSDGILECSVNVGGGATGDECPVEYQALGVHRVTTLYTAGEESATVTETETIEPLSTSVLLNVSYEPLPVTQSDFGCGDLSECFQENGWRENGYFHIGTLTVSGNVQPWGTPPLSACPSGETACHTLALGKDGTESFPVYAMANVTVLEEKALTIGDTLALEPEAIKNVTLQGLPGFNQIPLADVGSGIEHFQVAAPDKAGYRSSTAVASVHFGPSITGSVERVACGC